MLTEFSTVLVSQELQPPGIYSPEEREFILEWYQVDVLEENSTELAAGSDYFQALEQRVLRTIETLKEERERRASLETHAGQLEEELNELRKERDDVRQRVERLLKQLDEA